MGVMYVFCPCRGQAKSFDKLQQTCVLCKVHSTNLCSMQGSLTHGIHTHTHVAPGSSWECRGGGTSTFRKTSDHSGVSGTRSTPRASGRVRRNGSFCSSTYCIATARDVEFCVRVCVHECVSVHEYIYVYHVIMYTNTHTKLFTHTLTQTHRHTPHTHTHTTHTHPHTHRCSGSSVHVSGAFRFNASKSALPEIELGVSQSVTA